MYRAAEVAEKGLHRHYAIISDSRAALDTLANNNALHPLAVHVRGILAQCQTKQKEVNLYWIKAHAGLEGNERADVLAKEAARLLKKNT